MKRVVLLVIVLSIFLHLHPFQLAYAGSVEMTKEFKDVAMSLAKEEFREFLFKRIQSQDLCLSIAIYDLLGKIIYSDKYDDVSRTIIESYVDYVSLLRIKSQVGKLLEEKEKDGAEFEERNVKVEDSNSEQDEKITNNKIDISTNTTSGIVTRDRFLSFSALYWYTLSRKRAGLPVSPYLLDLLEKNKDKFNVLLVFKKESNKDNQIWKARVIRELIDEKFEKGINVRYPELIKYVLVELLWSQEGWEAKIRKAYNDFYNVVKIENKGNIPEDPTTAKPILEFVDDNTPITKITQILRNDFKNIAGKESPAVKSEGAKFLSVVSSYALGIFDKPTESYRVINTERFVNDTLELFESLQAQHSKKGFGFAVGLWYGMFFSGQEWVNEDQSKMEYPVQSFRVNDRLQYTFVAINQGNIFVYAGGLVDMLTSNMFNKENKKYFYLGFGVKPAILRNLAICYSAAMPPTYSKNNVVGSVVSVMYDIPFSKIFKILRKN